MMPKKIDIEIMSKTIGCQSFRLLVNPCDCVHYGTVPQKDFSGVINENCGVEHEEEINTVQLSMSPGSQTQVNITNFSFKKSEYPGQQACLKFR